ncbi:MAG: 1-(5-phosphoribosyl)-5-[(5-phosphoribosylamino)methylideneamino] imidazole-4-carboxamide isomerase [Gemmatimonadota bacterium]
MLILPAIDLLEGRCVRLRQGRFDDRTVYSEDPLAAARAFAEHGAEALHIVDWEGARLGKVKNLEWIYRVREALSLFIQVGGGIRTFALASQLLKAGIDRIICGTAAAEDPRLLKKLVDRYGSDRIAAGLDLSGERLAVRGWESLSGRGLDELLINLDELGIRWITSTDVTRDGTLAGPGYELAERLIGEGFQVIVAGGVATRDHIVRIHDLGAAGCIIGSALYERVLSLQEALEAARAH